MTASPPRLAARRSTVLTATPRQISQRPRTSSGPACIALEQEGRKLPGIWATAGSVVRGAGRVRSKPCRYDDARDARDPLMVWSEHPRLRVDICRDGEASAAVRLAGDIDISSVEAARRAV